jgi:hypothetical protein
MNHVLDQGPYGALAEYESASDGPRKLVLTVQGREIPMSALIDPETSPEAQASTLVPFPASDAGAPARPAMGGGADAPASVFFVLQRQNGHWSVGAKIMGVFSDEAEAEHAALGLKTGHPQQSFGVANLRSEARTVPQPHEIVRVAS